MIQSVKVTNYLGETLTLELRNPETSGFFIKHIEGLGPVKSTVNMTEVLSADGAFFNSSRIGPRNIVMNLGMYDDGSVSVETLRQLSYQLFPTKKSVTLEIQTDNRLGITSGYVESNEPNIFSDKEDTFISILCPSAFFLESGVIQTIFTGFSGGFEFPFENTSLVSPTLQFGQIFVNTSGNVIYTGDEETGVIIYINVTGAVNGLSIFNLGTDETMLISSAQIIAITGHDLQAGDQIIISTLKGNKYIYLIRSGVTFNILNALGTTADWFTIDRGDNVFTYTAVSGLANLQFMIEHQVVYKGL